MAGNTSLIIGRKGRHTVPPAITTDTRLSGLPFVEPGTRFQLSYASKHPRNRTLHFVTYLLDEGLPTSAYMIFRSWVRVTSKDKIKPDLTYKGYWSYEIHGSTWWKAHRRDIRMDIHPDQHPVRHGSIGALCGLIKTLRAKLEVVENTPNHEWQYYMRLKEERRRVQEVVNDLQEWLDKYDREIELELQEVEDRRTSNQGDT